jgi:hypothetical protein
MMISSMQLDIFKIVVGWWGHQPTNPPSDCSDSYHYSCSIRAIILNAPIKLLLFFSLLPCITIAQQKAVLVSPTLSQDSIYIGQEISYQVLLPSSAGLNTDALKISFPSNNKIEIVQQKDIIKKEGKAYYEAIITSYDTGLIVIPVITISPKLAIRNSAFYVKSIAVDTSGEYRDIKAIIPIEKKRIPYWYYIAGAGILLLLCTLLYLVWKKRKPKTIVRQKVSTNPLQEALQQLQQLDKSNLLAQQQFKILKNYCWHKGIVQQINITNQELKLTVNKIHIELTEKNNLQQSLQLSSYVQYAKYIPATDLCKTALQQYTDGIIALEKTTKHAV